MLEVKKYEKFILCLLKLENTFFHLTHEFSEAVYKLVCQIDKDQFRQIIEEYTSIYKNFDEQLDENQLEIKNNLGEIIEKYNLLLKKLGKYPDFETFIKFFDGKN